jgi:hypothetical protein
MENLLVKSAKDEMFSLKVYIDEDPMNPREWDNLGTMVCWHSRYQLGDEQAVDLNWYDSLEDWYQETIGDAIALPLYIYDHGGITMSTGGFSCHWDSGQVGYIYVTKEQVRKEYGVKRISKKLRNTVIRVLEFEVKNYDDYLVGNYYGYNLSNIDDDIIDSLWGIQGDDLEENIKEYLPEEYHHLVDNLEERWA